MSCAFVINTVSVQTCIETSNLFFQIGIDGIESWFDFKAILINFIVDKDVTRTDRTHQFFQGEENPNLQVLYDILMTYCMYNFDLGKLSVQLLVKQVSPLVSL